MSSMQEVLDPVAPVDAAGAAQAFRPLPTLAGAVVGFIDNSKPNFNLLADDLGELLRVRYGVARVVRHRKRTASMPAPAAVFADLKAQCDLVITGSGD